MSGKSRGVVQGGSRRAPRLRTVSWCPRENRSFEKGRKDQCKCRIFWPSHPTQSPQAEKRSSQTAESHQCECHSLSTEPLLSGGCPCSWKCCLLRGGGSKIDTRMGLGGLKIASAMFLKLESVPIPRDPLTQTLLDQVESGASDPAAASQGMSSFRDYNLGNSAHHHFQVEKSKSDQED